MNVIEVSEEWSAKWDAFVGGERTRGLFQLWGWQSIFEGTFAVRARYLAAEEGGEVRGVLPLVEFREWSGKKFVSSLWGGICTSLPEARNDLLDEAKKLADECGAARLLIRDDPVGLEGLQSSSVVHASILPLPDNPAPIWMSLKSEVRNRVRKAQKAGLVVDSDQRYLADFYRVYAENQRDLGTPVFPLSYFERMLRTFGDRFDLLVVKKGELVVAGMMLWNFGEQMTYPFYASRRAYLRDCPNDLLHWNAIERAIDWDCSLFDMGRSQAGSGTQRFKRKWGAADVELRSYEFKGGEQVFREDGRPAIATRLSALWRRLPLTVASHLGPIVRRRLPMG